MKYVLILSILFAGCSLRSSDFVWTDPNTLKFHAGERVRPLTGFYSDCRGIITDFARGYDKSTGPAYLVDLFCGPSDGEREEKVLLERDLVKR
jgi:hypothetical protein